MAERFDQQLLLAYVEGELEAADQARVQAWLREDPRLADLLAQMIADREALRQMPDPTPPQWIMEEVDRHLERDMLMQGLPQPVQGRLGWDRGRTRRRRVAGTVYTGGAVAAMLAIVGGVIFLSITGVNPARELASQVGLSSGDVVEEPADTPRMAEADPAPDAAGDTLPGLDDLDAIIRTPPSVPSGIEPQPPDEHALTDDLLAQIAPGKPAESLSPDLATLEPDAAESFTEPDALSGAEDAAEAIIALQEPGPVDALGMPAIVADPRDLTGALHHEPHAGRMPSQPGGEIDRSLLGLPDPFALAPLDHPVQLPGDPSAFSGAGANLDLAPQARSSTPQPVGPLSLDGPADPSDPLGIGADPLGQFPVARTAERARRGMVGFEDDATAHQLRALVDRAVLPAELELRIEAEVDVALNHLRQFGELPEIATADEPAMQFDLTIATDRVEKLIRALEQDEKVRSVQLNRQHVLAAGRLPGEPERDTTAQQLWPSLVPDYDAILEHRLPRDPDAQAPPIDLPVRLVQPATD